jgi:hypothetical protein
MVTRRGAAIPPAAPFLNAGTGVARWRASGLFSIGTVHGGEKCLSRTQILDRRRLQSGRRKMAREKPLDSAVVQAWLSARNERDIFFPMPPFATFSL